MPQQNISLHAAVQLVDGISIHTVVGDVVDECRDHIQAQGLFRVEMSVNLTDEPGIDYSPLAVIRVHNLIHNVFLESVQAVIPGEQVDDEQVPEVPVLSLVTAEKTSFASLTSAAVVD